MKSFLKTYDLPGYPEADERRIEDQGAHSFAMKMAEGVPEVKIRQGPYPNVSGLYCGKAQGWHWFVRTVRSKPLIQHP